jgi:hypothetical protein
MKNSYRIVDYSELGLPCIEVSGDQFHYQDLYELVGCNRYMTTFQLKVDSESYKEFGSEVLGVIHYDATSLKVLKNSLVDGTEITKNKIRIDSADCSFSLKQKGDCKYRGINVDDIEHISFLPYKREAEKYETGEKKVPDIVTIKVNCSGMDADILKQNYLVSKLNSGDKLIQYEKEQLVGITLAFNGGRIDSRILEHLGFCEDDLKSNLNIWNQLYHVKKRRGQLTDIDKKNYSEVKSVLSMEKTLKLVREMSLSLSGIKKFEDESKINALKEIYESVINFSPSILMHGKFQVYWDVDSYIHIVLRHVKKYQVGNYENKTPFPYKTKDLKSLMEKVIQQVEEELKHHLSQETGKNFTRQGKMAIFYNGDHYHLRINADGRVTQFHVA